MSDIKTIIGICGFNEAETNELRNRLPGVEILKLNPTLGEYKLHEQIETTSYVIFSHPRSFKDKSITEEGVSIVEHAIRVIAGKYSHSVAGE